MRKIDESEFEAHNENSNLSEIGASSAQYNRVVNISNRAWKLNTDLAPQDVSIEIRIDTDAHKCFLILKKGDTVSRFAWQDWVDAAMGFLSRWNDRNGAQVKYERKIRRTDLRDAMVVLPPLRMGDEETSIETSDVKVWMGWPPFDVRICKFEMEQWLNAFNIDLGTHRLVPDGSEHKQTRKDLGKEIGRAEKVIETVLFGQADECNEHIRPLYHQYTFPVN